MIQSSLSAEHERSSNPSPLVTVSKNKQVVSKERRLSSELEKNLIADALKTESEGRRIYFLHLHKAGGTTVCHVARVANGLVAPKRNCNLPGDGPRTLDKGLSGHANLEWDTQVCERRAQAYDEWGLNFHAVERWLDVNLLRNCRSHFFFATVIREPVSRFVSHCRFERTPTAEAMAWAKRDPVPNMEDEFSAVQRGPAVLDNFYVRSLNGRDTFLHVPFGQLTENHLVTAAENLASFQVVMILERLDNSFQQLYHKLNWCMPDKSHTRRSFGKGDDSIVFSKSQLDAIAEINHYDARLYSFADSLAQAIQNNLDIQQAPKKCKPGGKMKIASPPGAEDGGRGVRRAGRDARRGGRKGRGGRGRRRMRREEY
uniref:Heparan-sulfate 6-O-sulfotransferase n=1 Tax=Aureoumbra lagunensis TaxID=44058 RepID=A0A7S3NIZ3_9STRA